MRFAAQSHVGMVRKENQDCYRIFDVDNTVFCIVADGMGGHKGGSTASSMAVAEILKNIENEYRHTMTEDDVADMFTRSVAAANEKIFERGKSDENLNGMGTTLSMATVVNNRLIIAHVGDSRVYIINGGINQVSEDHSLVQALVSEGRITAEEAQHHPRKHVILRAVGSDKEVVCDIYRIDYHNEIVLICSDGLTDMLEDNVIMDTVKSSDSLQKAADRLVCLANEAGGNDNITVAMIASDDKEANSK